MVIEAFVGMGKREREGRGREGPRHSLVNVDDLADVMRERAMERRRAREEREVEIGRERGVEKGEEDVGFERPWLREGNQKRRKISETVVEAPSVGM